MIDRIIAAAAVLAAQGATTTPPCLTLQELGDLAIVLLPHVIDGATQRCSAHLSQDAFLLGNGGRDFAQRLTDEGSSRRASAVASYQRVLGPPLPGDASQERALQLMGEAMTRETLGSASAGGCRNFNALAEAISPLPAANVGHAVAAIFAMAVSRPQDTGVCPA